MRDWSLSGLLDNLHRDVETRLTIARSSFAHPGTKGDATEGVWLEALKHYLPKRYQAEKAHVVDSKGQFSQQIDIVIFDRQYSPFIFNFHGQLIVPAESVYAVFEAKQTINAAMVGYAQEKAASVRRLHRTSLPIPHAGGVYPPKALAPIMAGILALESEWKPAMGEPLRTALTVEDPTLQLELGCVATHGIFTYDKASSSYRIDSNVKPAAAFLFTLISRLQQCATVPMIDIDAYGAWLTAAEPETR